MELNIYQNIVIILNSSKKTESIKLVNEILEYMFYDYVIEKKVNLKSFKARKIKKIKKILKKYMLVDDVNSFLLDLLSVKDKLLLDASFFLINDPAAPTIEEVILAYPGFFAIFLYRVSHLLSTYNVALIPKIISEYAHELTGIDINHKALIDCPFFIDHGTGVVIGETCRIGKFVRIYQGVTLGAKSLNNPLSKVGKKRHPTINDNVTIYCNATILGGDTIIGENVIIGANSLITHSIKENTITYVDKNYTITKELEKHS